MDNLLIAIAIKKSEMINRFCLKNGKKSEEMFLCSQ